MTWDKTGNGQAKGKEATHDESRCFVLTSIELFDVPLNKEMAAIKDYKDWLGWNDGLICWCDDHDDNRVECLSEDGIIFCLRCFASEIANVWHERGRGFEKMMTDSVNATESVAESEKLYTLQQLRQAWGAGKNQR